MPGEWKGIPAASGLARGQAHLWSETSIDLPDQVPADPTAERARLADARAQAGDQLYALSAQILHQLGETEAALFEAQAMFLEDPGLVQKAESAIGSGTNAERAWHQACEFFASQLEILPDESLRSRSADVRDVGRRVIEILMHIQTKSGPKGRSILIARDLTPSQTAEMDPSRIVAFCTAEGGPTSHTAILANALGIPAVVGMGEGFLEIEDGTMLLVDGSAGLVVSDPTSEMTAAFEGRIEAEARQHEGEMATAFQPAVTTDGQSVEVAANVGNMQDARNALKYGAEGIGLLRTEFLFLHRSKPPDEKTQMSAYRSIFEMMGTRPIVVRTLDIGGDKEVPYYDFGSEANPFLGYRAIRISLEHADEFKSQLRALLQAAKGHDMRLMFPMIATLDEFRQAKKLVEQAGEELSSSGTDVMEGLQIGIMVEIPSVSILADRFASEVDFFSIGTNDLTQYTMAAERGNKRLAHLNDPCHPAILRQIDQVVRAAHARGKWVGICGEMGGDPDAVPILLGLGVDELSMSAARIPRVKQIIRKWSVADARQVATRALELENAVDIRRLVNSSYPYLT